ncbi:3'(2'),5'-bisphosphate nucleotidase CysQ [Aquifex sp.]
MLQDIVYILLEAGEQVLEIYNKDFSVEYKEDKTPLTEADRTSHKIITEGLKKLTPDIPIISEEGRDIPYEERKNFEKLWLVDPLDGTKEFINKRDEFTLNVALVIEGEPVLGVVYAPAKNVIYFAEKGKGAFKGDVVAGDIFDTAKLPLKFGFEQPLKVVASRSHRDDKTEEFIQRLSQSFLVESTSAGSSLKFCLLAEGKADIYPRFGPTMEWDTAAGHAVLKEAGGLVYSLENLEELRYNKESLKNGPFVALRREVAPHILPLLKRS